MVERKGEIKIERQIKINKQSMLEIIPKNKINISNGRKIKIEFRETIQLKLFLSK